MFSNNHLQYDDRNPYIQYSAAPSAVESGKNKMRDAWGWCGKRFEDYTKMAEEAADNTWNYLKVSPSVGDAAKARFVHGTKLLTEGGSEKIFKQAFGSSPGEKYLNSFACYLKISSGPVNGTLYISTKRLAFCSVSPLCYCPSPGQPQWIHYKVVIELDRLATVESSQNLLNPSEKDIRVVTRDGHEFLFMGFISFNKAFKSLTEALKRSHA